MSRVFLARDNGLNRQVVVKVVPIDGGLAAVERFRREITTAAQLQHPHIVPVLSAGDAAGGPYFTIACDHAAPSARPIVATPPTSSSDTDPRSTGLDGHPTNWTVLSLIPISRSALRRGG